MYQCVEKSNVLIIKKVVQLLHASWTQTCFKYTMHAAYMKTMANIKVKLLWLKLVTTLCCTYISDNVVIKYEKAF